MNKIFIFMFRHFTNRQLQTITKIPTKQLAKIRRNPNVITEKQYHKFYISYGRVQYARIRNAGLNREDSQKLKYYTPKLINEYISESLRLASIITRSEIKRLRKYNERAKREGLKLKRIPNFKNKFQLVLKGMKKSRMALERKVKKDENGKIVEIIRGRWEWEEKYSQNR